MATSSGCTIKTLTVKKPCNHDGLRKIMKVYVTQNVISIRKRLNIAYSVNVTCCVFSSSRGRGSYSFEHKKYISPHPVRKFQLIDGLNRTESRRGNSTSSHRGLRSPVVIPAKDSLRKLTAEESNFLIAQLARALPRVGIWRTFFFHHVYPPTVSSFSYGIDNSGRSRDD